MDWYVIHREDSLVQRNRRKEEEEWSIKQRQFEGERARHTNQLVQLQEEKANVEKIALQKQVLVTSLSAEAESKKKGIQKLDEEIDKLQKTKQTLQEQIWASQLSLKTNNEQLTSVQNRLNSLQQETQVSKRSSDQKLQDQVQEVENSVQTLSTKKQQAEQDLMVLISKQNQLNEEVKALEARKVQILEVTRKLQQSISSAFPDDPAASQTPESFLGNLVSQFQSLGKKKSELEKAVNELAVQYHQDTQNYINLMNQKRQVADELKTGVELPEGSAVQSSCDVSEFPELKQKQLEKEEEKRWKPYYVDKSASLTVHVIPHTHWDREWYLSFENFRYRLVNLMDDVLHFMETDDAYNHFHMDGQMAPIDDFLEVRPQKVNEIGLRNRQGRISLGPWYVQPDEFLVSAESMVRNLMLGIRRANEVGGNPLLLGYLPDSFGHISQLPQIFRGFEIDTSCIARGVSHSDAQHFEQFWSSPDGSWVFVIYIVNWYCNGIDETDVLGADKVAHSNTPAVFQRKISETRSKSRASNILLMNGCDHTSPSENARGWIDALNQDGSFTNVKIIHSNFTHYLDAVKKDLGVRSVPTMKSETPGVIPLRPNEKKRLREDWIGEKMESSVQLTSVSGEQKHQVDGLANILSTKIRQKQSNWRVQSLLERWVEPFSAFIWRLTEQSTSSGVAKHKYDHDKIWYSWKTLLQNHPHDSIGGCSVTDVHKEVDMRFEKSEKVGKQLATDSVSLLAHHAGVDVKPRLSPNDHPSISEYIKVVVFNPTNLDRTNDIVVGIIDAPRLVGHRGGIPKLSFFDASTGESVEGILLQIESHWDYMLPRVGFRQPYHINRIAVAFPATAPPLGYSTYLMSPAVEVFPNSPENQQYINNDILELKFTDDKHLVLSDIATKEILPFHINFEDAMEHGDEYASRTSSPQNPSRIRLEGTFNSPVMSRMDMEFGFADSQDHNIKVYFFLWKGVRRVDIRVVYENKKSNHRLRVTFNLEPLKGYFFEAESQFDVLDRNNEKYNGQQGFINSWNQQTGKGVAIANRGLPEYQVVRGHVHITLVRGTSQVGDWGHFPTSPSSQEFGSHNFELSFIPYEEVEAHHVHQVARQFVHSLQIVQSWNYPGYQSHKDHIDLERSSLVLATSNTKHYQSAHQSGGNQWLFPVQHTTDLRLPSRLSFFNVTPNYLEVSTIKKTETRDSIIVRFWNPKSVTVQAVIGVGIPYTEVWKCLLNENRIALLDVEPDSPSFHFSVRPKTVVTLEFV